MSDRLKTYLKVPVIPVQIVGLMAFMIMLPCIALLPFALGYYFSQSISNSAFGDNSFSVMNCSHVTMAHTKRGFVDFSVLIPTNFKTGSVSKTQMTPGDHLVKIGTDVIWHGTYNIEEMNDFPSSNLTFTNKDLNDTCSFRLDCRDLEIMLFKQYRNFWKNINEQNLEAATNDETLLNLNDKPEIHCTNVIVYKTFLYVGPVEFKVKFPNPFGIEFTNVTKHPMSMEDKFVNTGKQIVWYGSAKFGGEGLATSLLSLQRTNPYSRDYFKLVCPNLEAEVQGVFVSQWENYNNKTFDGIIFVIVTISGLSLIVGLFYADCVVRKTAKKALI